MHPDLTRVILLRHGRSTYNDLGLYQGSSDASRLTSTGEAEACQTGSLLQTMDVAAIYSSPLQRARQTVEILTAELAKMPLTIKAELREIDLPGWQGLSLQQVREDYAEAYRCWQDQPHRFHLQAGSDLSPGSVSLLQEPCFPVLDLYQRAAEFWAEILPLHHGQTIVVVSHAGTIRALISTAIGLDPSHYHQLQQSNCGFSLLQFRASQPARAELQLMNVTTHLGEVLPKLKEGKQGLRLLILPNSLARLQRVLIQKALHQVDLDFSLISPAADSSFPLQDVLPSFPSKQTLQLDPCTPPHRWQALIDGYWCMAVAGNTPPQRPLTGLIVAPPPILQLLLHNTVFPGFEPEFPLAGLSVLHFPTSDRRPILQALNLYHCSTI
jgi:probable phosphoglycerate mutase